MSGSGHRVPLGVAVWTRYMRGPAGVRYTQAVIDHFDSITPEVELKMDNVATAPGEWTFDAAERLAVLATTEGKEMRGHALLWHKQIPAWVLRRTWTQARMTDFLSEHVAVTMNAFRGRIREWDVVNEPLADDGSFRASLWSETLGPEYIGQALTWAREADPTAKLFINEYGAEHGQKSDGLLRLAAKLREAGAPLDGIGFQMHVSTSCYPREHELAATFARFAELGLEVRITEMDIRATDLSMSPSERAVATTEIYQEAARACAAEPQCRGFTVWGVDDSTSWLRTDKAALLLDDDLQPKPAMAVIRAEFDRVSV